MSAVAEAMADQRRAVLTDVARRVGQVDTVTRFGADGVARHRTAEEFQADVLQILRALQ